MNSARLAQWESASLTRKRSLVQSQYRALRALALCGCSAVGSASPCQGEGREFESRHPLQGPTSYLSWGSSFTIGNDLVEWPSGEATVCKTVHTGSIPVSTSMRGSRTAVSPFFVCCQALGERWRGTVGCGWWGGRDSRWSAASWARAWRRSRKDGNTFICLMFKVA